jgi:hypothetical protein
MHAANGKRAVMVDDVRNKHQRGEERECLKEIRRRLIHSVGEAAEWWYRLFAAAGRPVVASLKTDKV